MTFYHRGNLIIEHPEMPTQEFDTFMCCHCGGIIVVQPSGSTNLWSPPEEIALIGTAPDPQVEEARQKNKRRRGVCFRCMGITCGREKCAKCIPFEAQLEAIEGTRRFWRQQEILTGNSY